MEVKTVQNFKGIISLVKNTDKGTTTIQHNSTIKECSTRQSIF